jgi:ribonuclease HII
MENKKKSIKDIKAELLAVHSTEDEMLVEYLKDTRAGVQKLILQTKKRLAKEEALQKKQDELLMFEREFWNNGEKYIAGIDEVGRGPLAGPVVACAVVLPHDVNLPGVNDSKQVSHKKRLEFVEEINRQAVSIGIGVMSEEVIDDVNIYEATKLAMQEAIDNLTVKPNHLLIDAMKLDNGIPQENLIKGDAKSLSIAAASIVAKVTRDEMMEEYAKTYPGYGFEKNAGYGTREHLEGLEKIGITPIHRKTFEPVKSMLKNL